MIHLVSGLIPDMQEVLASYYPTTVLMIDDNARFLKSIIAILDDSRFHYKPFDSPHFALDFLNNLYKLPNTKKQYVTPYEDSVCVSTYKTIYNFSRFTDISTILIDYEMPGITGVEFCNSIKLDSPIECVMLTGVATSALANKIMHSKIISHFIKKNDMNFAKRLMEVMLDSQNNYFKQEMVGVQKMCSSVRDGLYIATDEYKQFFNHVVLKREASEYYLLDECGSYLLVNKDKSLSAIFVWNRQEGMRLFNRFSGQFDLSTINKIASGDSVICFPYKTEHVNPQDLGVFIHPTTRYSDQISYAWVDDVSYFIKSQHITFFDEYKAKIAFSEQYCSTLFNA